MLLGIAYFPPVSYFALMAKGFRLSADDVEPSVVYLEACEHYRKQSWRNRCRILAADGPVYLQFPVVHPADGRPVRDVRVDYSVPWVVRTERAITSAYESSGYFFHYRDELFSILDSHPETLFDLDLQLIRFFLRTTGISADLRLTDRFTPPSEDGMSPYGEDWRYRLHPKRPSTVPSDLQLEKPYFQVFARKYGFVSDLSIMDLLFNEGPESITFLMNR